MKPLNIKDIDLEKINYLSFKEKSNKKIIPIKYGNTNFVFQIPSLQFNNHIERHDTYEELELVLHSKNNDQTDKLIKFLNNLENKIKKDASSNVNSWFFNNSNTAISCMNFQKIIRYSENFNSPVLKLKIMKSYDFETSLFNIDDNDIEKKITSSEIPKDSFCKSIVECFAIWINSSNDFGIFIRPIVLSFSLKKKLNYNYVFNDEESEDNIDVPDTDINNNMFLRIVPNTVGSNVNNTTNSNLHNELKTLKTNLTEINELSDNDDTSVSDNV